MMCIWMDFLYFSIFVHILHLHYLIVLRRPKNGRCFRQARRGISNFQWVAFCVYFVFAGSAPLLLGCSENGWCALASLKAAISWMSPQGKRQTWRRTLYPQDKYWCSHCCQTNTHDCHWLHTFQMYLQPHWWTYRGCYSHFMNVTTEQCLQTTNMTTGFNCWKCTSFTSVL